MNGILKLVNTFRMSGAAAGEGRDDSRKEQVGREKANERESIVVCKNFSSVISYEMHHRRARSLLKRKKGK